MLCSSSLLAVPFVGVAFGAPTGHQAVQPRQFGYPSNESQQRADAVKEAFQFAWDGYYKLVEG